VKPTVSIQPQPLKKAARQDFAGPENVHKGCPEILSKLSAHFCSEIWAERTHRDLANFDSRYFTMITKSIGELPNATWVPPAKLLLNSW
jgi:hypothetical protein